MQFESKKAPLLAAAALVSALSVVSAPANAGLILTLSDGSTTQTVSDANDTNPFDGIVSFVGTIGAWAFNFTSGLSETDHRHAV